MAAARSFGRASRFAVVSLLESQIAKFPPCSGEMLPCSVGNVSLFPKLGNLGRNPSIKLNPGWATRQPERAVIGIRCIRARRESDAAGLGRTG
jgi:hypothetical protein